MVFVAKIETHSLQSASISTPNKSNRKFSVNQLINASNLGNNLAQQSTTVNTKNANIFRKKKIH